MTEENDVLRKRIASMDENAITRLQDKKDAEIKELQERLGKAESDAVRSGNKAYSEHQRAENAENQVREMLGIPEIKEIWDSIQQKKEAFRKLIDKWIEDGVAAIRVMLMAKTTTSSQSRVTLLHGVALLKHSGMALTRLTKSNVGWLLPIS